MRAIAPSILSADFARLGEQVDAVLGAGAKVIHVDVMDGHFVPPITMGPLVVSALRPAVHRAGAILDVHLMVERPERHVDDFAAAGEAPDGRSAIAAAGDLKPEVVLLDINLPDIDGFAVASRLAAAGGPAVVLTSSRDSSDFGPPVARRGARGF